MSPGCGNRPLWRSVTTSAMSSGRRPSRNSSSDPTLPAHAVRMAIQVALSSRRMRIATWWSAEPITDHHRVDAARLYGQMAHAAVAQVGPAVRQTSRVLGERLDVLAPLPAPEAPGERSPAQLHRLHLHAACGQTGHLRDGPLRAARRRGRSGDTSALSRTCSTFRQVPHAVGGHEGDVPCCYQRARLAFPARVSDPGQGTSSTSSRVTGIGRLPRQRPPATANFAESVRIVGERNRAGQSFQGQGPDHAHVGADRHPSACGFGHQTLRTSALPLPRTVFAGEPRH